MEDKKIKYLEFIENVIERMARNSFMLKGWAITVFAGVLALADTDHILVPLIATIVTTVMFWYLDSFYLQQERLYRSLYDKARATSNNDIDFSFKAPQYEFPSKRNTICSCLFSKTEKQFYGILLVINVVLIILKFNCLL